MQVELRSGAVRLGPNQTLKVLDGAGSTVCAVEGSVWITEENQPRDIVLEAGGCYRLRHPGVAIVNSLAGEAAVSLQDLIERAHRERAQAVHRILIAPIARLFTRRRAQAVRRLELGACSRTAS